jgi:hypothetical protein
MGHVTTSELLSQEGRAQSHGTRDSIRAHLVKEARTGAERHVVAPELISARRRGPGPWDTLRRWSLPLQGGVVRSYNLCDSIWMHALLLILTYSLYAEILSLQGTDNIDIWY